MAEESIKLSTVLGALDEIIRGGKKNQFSIKFVSLKGEVIYIQRAIKVGLRMNVKNRAMRGIQPIDKDGEKIGHIYPVKIWHILEFNGKRIYQ